MKQKIIIRVVLSFILVLTLSDISGAEMRSGISFDNSATGIKLIEFIMEDESFYLDFKSEYDKQEYVINSFGYRRYWNKNVGPFLDASLLIQSKVDNSDSAKVGFGAGIGYVYQLSDSFFLNLEGGYDNINDDYYLGGSIDLSWSNLFSNIDFTSSNIRIETSRRIETPVRRDDQEHGSDGRDEVEEDDLEDEDETEDGLEEGRDYFIYQGQGNEYIELSDEYKKGILALHGNLGTRNSYVLGYDKQGEKVEDFLKDDRVYRVRELIYFQPKEETTHLEISLPGSWQLLSLPQISGMNKLVRTPVELSGSGSDLIAIKGDARSIDIEANQAEKYFEVIIWGNNLNKRSLVKSNQFYQDRINLSQSGFYLLEVIASDDWEIIIN